MIQYLEKSSGRFFFKKNSLNYIKVIKDINESSVTNVRISGDFTNEFLVIIGLH